VVSFGQGLVDGIRRGYCAYFRQIQNAEDWFARVSRLPRVGLYDDLSDSLYRWQCGPEDDRPQLPPPPFEGGQCPVTYLVDLVNTSTTAPFPATGQAFVTGPIKGVRTDPGINPGTIFVVVEGASDVGFRTGNEGELWSISGVSRFDNQPDNCGDPPPIQPPVTPVEINIDIDYDGGSVTNIPITIGPFFVAIGGAIYAPVEINLPDVNLTGNLNITPEFSFSPEFNLNIGGVETGPDSDPPPDDPGGPGSEEPGEPEDEPSDDRRIIAILCAGRIEDDARATGIYQEVGPDIYAPRLASVRFGTVIDRTVFWSNDIPIKGLRSVIECPIPWGASTVVLNAEPGVAMSYSPVRSLPADYPPFLELGADRLSDNR